MSTFEEVLERDGQLVYKTKGISMLPMLHQDRDLVVIVPARERLKPMDVALYRRGKAYVLHRVIEVKEDYYLIRGDNTYALERVPDANVIGVLTDFVRKKKQYSVNDSAYLRYVRFWNRIYPVRAVCAGFVRLLKKIARSLGLTPVLKKLLRRM